MLNEKDHTYLAKWLNGELSPEELEALEQLPEYEDYKKIVAGLSHFKAPDFDVQQSLTATMEKLNTAEKKAKVIKLKPLLYAISAAASVLLIIGLFFNKVTHSSIPGQQLAVVLPDGSNVLLNASSTLTHRRFFWSQQRHVKLDGEAYFDVISGSGFTVGTNQGSVRVLGTQFNVKARADEFQVACYEGEVRVTTGNDQEKILRKGEGVSLKDNTLTEENVTEPEPLWTKGESLFNSVPLKSVLDELERQYNVRFIRNAIDERKLFTGGFIHNNLSVALASVMEPMGIQYTINDNTITLSPQQ